MFPLEDRNYQTQYLTYNKNRMKDKKLLLLIFVLLFSTPAFSQFFRITPAGFVNATDSTKSYYVMDSLKLSKNDLFKKSVLYFNKQFASPKDVISSVDGESLTLNFIDRYKIIMGSLWNVNVTYTIDFKDDKVKISAPHINKIYNDKFSTISINRNDADANYPMYKRNGNGELRGKDGAQAKEVLESKCNSFVLLYLNELLKDDVKKGDNW
jgi:hypothetical protein